MDLSMRRRSNQMVSPKIVVVEDEAVVALDIKSKLEAAGYIVAGIAASGEEAVELVGQVNPDLVLMDIRLRGKVDGIDAARQIRARHDLPVVYLTAYADEMTLERAKVTEPYG